jgi:hypothetical protein
MFTTTDSPTRRLRPIPISSKSVTDPSRPSIRQLTSYYESEARKSMISSEKQSDKPTDKNQSFEDLISTYNDKIRKLELELNTIHQKILTLKEILNDIIVNKITDRDPHFELLELSSSYNEEILILGSIHAYNQIVKNIIKNETK